MTPSNKVKIITKTKVACVTIEVTTTGHPVDDLIKMILKGLKEGGAME